MTQIFLVTPTGSNQTYKSDDSWNNANNSIEVVGGGGAGAHGASTSTGGGGGAGGGYNKITNASPFATPGVSTVTYQIGIAGTAAGTLNGGDTWFNDTAFPTTGSNKVGAKGGPGPASTTTAAGGTAALTSAFFPTTSPPARAGGNGAAGTSATAGGGGGGGGGPNGAGGNASATTGGTGDGGTVTAGAAGNPGTSFKGTEWNATIGIGGGGGGSNASGGTGGTAIGFGGGAGGGSRSNGTGGNGSPGLIILTWVPTYLPPVNLISDGGKQAAIQAAKTTALMAGIFATQITGFAVPPNPQPLPSSGWMCQLSGAPKVAQAQAGFAFVPFNTPQVAPAVVGGWFRALSRPAPVAKAFPTLPTQFAAPYQNTIVGIGWHRWLDPINGGAKYASAQPTQPTQFAVPASATSATVVALALPNAAGAPRKRRVYYQALFNPLRPLAAAAVTPQGWQNAVSVAPSAAKAQPTQPTSFAVPASVAPPAQTPGQFGWWANLSKPAPVAQANLGSTFVPFNTAQIVISPQTVPLNYDAASIQQRLVYYQSSFQVLRPIAAPSNTITGIAWYQPLGIAAPVAQAKPGNTFVPFNTAQFVAVPPYGWYQPLGIAAPVAKVQLGNTFVPLNTAQITSAPAYGWYQPLSARVTVASANPTLPTQFAAPYQNTIVGIGWHRWLDAVNGGTKPATAQLTQPFVPFNTAQFFPAPPYGWYQPLGTPASVTKAQPGNIFIPFNTAQPSNSVTAFGWYQPLGRPAPVAQAQQGNTFVPLNTRQVNSIAGIGWYQNLSRSAPVAIAQAGFSFVPFNTPQIIVQVLFDPFVKKRSKPKRDRIRDELEIKYKRRLAIEEAFWPPTTYELPPYKLPEHVKPAPDVSDLANVIMQVQQMRAAAAKQRETDDEEDLMKILGEEYGIEDV